MTTRVYTYQNGGLPSDTAYREGEFTQLFKSALITGRENKQPAGWKLVREANNLIIVQSQSSSSDMAYYQISEQSGVFQISMARELQNNALVSPVVVYIDKIGQGWGGESFVVADEKFVWFGADHAVGCFGDFERLWGLTSSLVFGSPSQSNIYRFLPDTRQQVGSDLYDIEGRSMRLKCYNHFSANGFSLTSNGANATDNYPFASDGAQIVHKVELYLMQNNQRILTGYIPHLLYCDQLLNSGEYIANGKKIYKSPLLSGIGPLLFEVDEL